jgi:hypothetical protein
MILQPAIHYGICSSRTCTTKMLVKIAEGHFEEKQNTISKKKKEKKPSSAILYK